ncbi:FAD-dependent oxidoreductase [Cryobacterium tepidiphilum]|uniref:FAD-binding monooxygenase n=1 Tax=Cryobacterium tepidiphilum TaxID=2486026 RepID=A0A3M8L9Z5_9MICO|nr:FAD-dependent oxidoreductase [Cryobacterium tepidiphilum]RNE62266.1 FAD-binding monooxygenase [Cryobacterium tepidiphilum]
MRALVVGAGIAGLVAARQLGLAGWDVVVLEASPGPRTAGYMMDFFGPGVKASERIGLYPRLSAVSYRVEAAEYVDTNGRVTSRIDYDRFARAAGGRVLSLLRPDLERASLESLDDVPAGRVEVRYGARVSKVWADEHSAGVDVEGTAKATLTADVVIGADGIHSVVREQLFGPEQEFLRPLGMRAAAYIADAPDLHDRVGNRFLLTDSIDRTAALYGIRGRRVASFFVYRATGDDVDQSGARDRLRRAFSGLGANVDELLALCPAEPYDDVVAQVVMPTWHRERAILVGDACGAVSLLAGQGGSLAIAGAALVGDILGPVTSPAGIAPALAEVEDRWRPFVETAQASGRRAAASFLPANARKRLIRRWIIRASGLPGIDRLVARQIVKRIAT